MGKNEYTKDGKNPFESVEEEPILSYEVPVLIPGIRIDMSGYETENRKIAFFLGEEIPKSFEVVHKETNQTVLTKEILDVEYVPKENQYRGYGDFSILDTPGEYYIRCEYLGSSYSFFIKDNLYEDAFRQAYMGLSDLERIEETETESLCNMLAVILQSYELYPEVYEDGVVYEANHIPDLLDEAASVVSKLSERQDIETGRVEDCSALYAAVLSKFSYLYKKIDNVYATECLKAADFAWKYALFEENGENADLFFGATELYRATGQEEYHDVVIRRGWESLESERTPNIHLLYGAVTYLSTKRKVDVELCTNLMKEIMSSAENTINEAKESFYLAVGDKEKREVLYSYMILLTVADYISRSQEYAVIIENQYHYLNGRNPWSTDFLEEYDLEDQGYLLMIFSQMLQAGLEYAE